MLNKTLAAAPPINMLARSVEIDVPAFEARVQGYAKKIAFDKLILITKGFQRLPADLDKIAGQLRERILRDDALALERPPMLSFNFSDGVPNPLKVDHLIDPCGSDYSEPACYPQTWRVETVNMGHGSLTLRFVGDVIAEGEQLNFDRNAYNRKQHKQLLRWFGTALGVDLVVVGILVAGLGIYHLLMWLSKREM